MKPFIATIFSFLSSYSNTPHLPISLMRKLYLFLLFSFSLSLSAQTSISGGTLATSTWNLAGSPYIVQGAIYIPGTNVLTIDPGVTVKFMPQTKITVEGQLIANGTVGAPIVFEANDTTGWSNQSNTNGGWNGIQMLAYIGPGTDQSVFNYCTIRDVKYGYGFTVPLTNAFSCYRELDILNCTFHHNNSGTGFYVADPPLNLSTNAAGDTIRVDNCILYDNTCIFAIIRSVNNSGYTSITGSEFYNNHKGSSIWGIFNNLLIENNHLHHNTTDGDNGTIKVSIGTVVIRGNQIDHNTNEMLAAIGCRSGNVLIENNLVCNNIQTNGSCGALEGGGGLHLAHNEGGATFANTWYTVRNNIIANNQSAYGGGGIYVYHSRATISNNHIINNSSTSPLGRSLLILDPASEVYAKNNIFYSESSGGIMDTTNTIFILSANKFQLDNNYIPASFHTIVTAASSYILVGDTLDNVIGQDPQMIAPTANNTYTTDATGADFDILLTSPCIDEGDTTDAHPATHDYDGNLRIQGFIDVGAYEKVSKSFGIDEEINLAELKFYPNPVNSFSSINLILPENNGTLVLTDILGQIILSKKISSNEINMILPDIHSGIYTFTFYGKSILTAKVYVQ